MRLETAEALVSADPRPTAILVSDNLQTEALCRGLAKASLGVGRDVSILGLLTETRTQYLTPTLTTYQTDWTEIGVRLADAAMFEIAQIAAQRFQPIPEKPLSIDRRLQSKTPVAFSSGESVGRIEETVAR